MKSEFNNVTEFNDMFDGIPNVISLEYLRGLDIHNDLVRFTYNYNYFKSNFELDEGLEYINFNNRIFCFIKKEVALITSLLPYYIINDVNGYYDLKNNYNRIVNRAFFYHGMI